MERALGDGAVAEERHAPRRRRRGAAPRSPRRRRSAGRRRRCRWRRRSRAFGSAMCIEPPRPRLVPWSLRHQLGEHPERVEALGQAVAVAAVGRGDDVGRRAAASTRRRPPPPGRSTGGRSRAPRRRGRAAATRSSNPRITQHPPVHLERGRPREPDGMARRSRPCIVLIGTRQEATMTDQIEIPESFPGPGDVAGKRVVITGASRGLGALLAHAFSRAGASVALVARTETRPQGGRRRPARAVARAQRRRDRRGLQRGGRRRHRGRVGRPRRLDLQRRHLADRRPARARPTRRSGARSSRSTSPARSSAPAPPPG